jgi:predicted nuclease with TOPRIM domain
VRRVPVLGRLWRRAAWVLDWRFADLKRRVDAVGGRLAEIERTSAEGRTSTADLTTELRAMRDELAWLRNEVAEVGAAVTQVDGDVAALRDHVSPVLRAIVTRETANRERLERESRR